MHSIHTIPMAVALCASLVASTFSHAGEHGYFERTASFGNSNVEDPSAAVGAPDQHYAHVEERGRLTLDIGHRHDFCDGPGDDVVINATGGHGEYSVWVMRAPASRNRWIEIGHGEGSESFDLSGHIDCADFIEIRNGSHGHLNVDSVKAISVEVQRVQYDEHDHHDTHERRRYQDASIH